LKNFTNWFAMK